MFFGLIAWIAKQAVQLMPETSGPDGDELRTGFESRSRKAPSWATGMGDRAARQNNEMIAGRMLIYAGVSQPVQQQDWPAAFAGAS